MNGKDNFLLDTNIVLGFLSGNTKITDFFEKKLMQSNLHVSQVTRMELLGYPGITSQEKKNLKKFLSYVKILPINEAICDQAISLRREKKLKLPDALIAANFAVLIRSQHDPKRILPTRTRCRPHSTR